MENRNWLYSALIFIIAVLSVVLISCRKEKGDGITSSSTSLTFPANGGSQNVTITSSYDWSVVNIPSWVSATPSIGYKGRSVLVVTASNNYSTSERTGGIIVGNGSDNVTISISQSAADIINEISANVSSLSFSANGESKNISVTSNFSWEIIDKPSWITISPSSGTKGTTNLMVTASKSTSTISRTGSISLGKSSYATTSISVSQAAASSGWGSVKTLYVNNVSFDMIYVEGGTFMMGASDQDKDAYSNEKPAHRVTLSDYYIGETEVTVELYKEVMGFAPYWKDDKKPAVMSWIDGYNFIEQLNKKISSQLPEDCKLRFPTEAEWEFAARGGIKSRGYKYSGSNYIDDVAWYENNSTYSDGSNKGASEVKRKKANELGIYDMTGNMEEWCEDIDYMYTSDSQYNPIFTSKDFTQWRIQRGGSWSCPAKFCTITGRTAYDPTSTTVIRGSDTGLRLAISR